MSAAHPIFYHSVVFTFYFQQDQDRFIVCTSFRARVLAAYCKRALENLGRGVWNVYCSITALIAALTQSLTQYIYADFHLYVFVRVVHVYHFRYQVCVCSFQ